MAYLGRTPSQATRSRYYFTASGGETSLSGNDSNGNTLTFTDGNFVDVNLNGATLVAGSDYNTTTANTIAGLAALAASDVVEIVVYDTFSVFGGNVLGDFTVSNGTLTAEAVAISSLSTTGNITFGDNDKAIFGAGSDLQIYHDGSNSYIDDVTGSGTGDLFIKASDAVRVLTTNFVVNNAANNENMITAAQDGAAKLFFNGSTKIATSNTGVDVTGTVTTDGLTVDTADQVLINHSGDGGGIRIDSTNATNTSSLRFGDVADNYIGALEYNHSNDSMTMYVNNAERMRIDSDGKVGIGAAPSYTLTVQKDVDDYIAKLENDGNSTSSNGLWVDTRWNTATNTPFQVTTNSGSTPVIVTKGDGKVGIGTAAPARLMELSNTTNPAIRLNNGNSNVDIGVASAAGAMLSGAADDDLVIARNGAYGISIGTDGSSRLKIDASGNVLVGASAVGVGTSASATGAVIRGSIGYLEIARDNSNPVRLNRQSNDGSIIDFAKDGVTVGGIGTIQSDVYTGTGDTTIRFADGSDAILPSGANGGIRDGAVQLGHSSHRFKDLYLSGGAYLGGTGAANKLEDYEEGTWTPASPDVTLSGIQTSTYAKIGRMVFVQAKFIFPTSSSGSTARVNGLPFAVNGNGTNSQYNLSSGEHTFGSYITCPVIPTTTIIFRPNGGPSASYATVSGKSFRLSGWYET